LSKNKKRFLASSALASAILLLEEAPSFNRLRSTASLLCESISSPIGVGTGFSELKDREKESSSTAYDSISKKRVLI
tara:strand:+ start:663 stop:893 length:231 start_codon:yes stop_codon:yes gene_type:complete